MVVVRRKVECPYPKRVNRTLQFRQAVPSLKPMALKLEAYGPLRGRKWISPDRCSCSVKFISFVS